LVADAAAKIAAVIDPVLGFDPVDGSVDTRGADQILAAADDAGLTITWFLETHVHADHLSSAHYLNGRTGATLCIGEGVDEVQRVFAPKFGADDVKPDGGDFDRLLGDGDVLGLGGLQIEVMATPGHTPACVAYRIA